MQRSIEAPATRSEMLMWGSDTSTEQCYMLYVFCLVHCFGADEVVHTYIFACVSTFSEGFVQFYLYTQANWCLDIRQKQKSCSRNNCNKFIMYFYIIFCTWKNNIKWPFQIRTLCLIMENNLINITMLRVSSVIILNVPINWSLWCSLY